MKKEKQQGKDRKIFKSILKFTGWFFLVILLVVGVGALGAWWSGSFDPEKIYVQELSIGGKKEFVTITQNDDSYSTQIDYLPAEANQLTLTAKIITGGDLIEPLGVVTAGQPLNLKFKKDENNITKGGEVEIKFIDSAQKAFTTLKVLIDVGLNSSYIDVKSNGVELVEGATPNVLSTNVLTTISQESANKIKVSADYDEMLNSYKGNWSPSENNSLVSLDKLKKMILRYKDDVRVRDFKITEVIGESNYYLIEYITPATTDEAFALEIYLYKTYFLESVYDEAFANSIFAALEKTDFNHESVNYEKLNSFINTYVYPASNVDTKNNFAIFVNESTGLIELNPVKYVVNSEAFLQAMNDVIDYVFAKKTVLISVDKVEIQGIYNAKKDAAEKNIVFPVLQGETYTIDDINEKLGISLVGTDETVDKQVLHNLLRDINIELCSEDTSFEETFALVTDANLKKKMIYEDYYMIDGMYLKKVANDSTENKLKIVKKEAEDGSISWELSALSPTQSNSKYHVVYSYTKNDFGSLNSNNIVVGTARKEGEQDLKTYYYNTEDGCWYSTYNTTTKRFNNIVYEIYVLNQLFNRKFSSSPLHIKYTPGTIQFNNNVNNKNKTRISLNAENSIYTNNSQGQAVVVRHGAESGVYYNALGRDFTVGVKTSEEQVMTSNVIIKANDIEKTMEYKCVKWFVPYNANIVKDSAGAIAIPQRYYFKPVVNKTYAENGNANEVPMIYKLRNIDGGTLLESTDSLKTTDFMEIGKSLIDADGNIYGTNIQALNAMEKEDEPIQLYAVIVQTDKDGNPIAELKTLTETTYRYIAVAGGTEQDHTLVSMQRVDNLYTYINDGGFKNVVSEDGAGTTHNWLKVSDVTVDMYVSAFKLNNNGEVITSNSDWYDENNRLIMSNAVDEYRNKAIALKKFYSEILGEGTKNISWVEYVHGVNYPVDTPTFTIDDADDRYLIFRISYSSQITKNWQYALSIFSTPNTTSENAYFFTDKYTTGYIELVAEESGPPVGDS